MYISGYEPCFGNAIVVFPQKWLKKLSNKSACTSCDRYETEIDVRSLRCLILEEMKAG